MIRSHARGVVLGATLTAIGAGCSDLVQPTDTGNADLQAAFSTMPVGYSSTLNTFSGQEGEFTPPRLAEGGRRHHGSGPGHGALMGGGLIGPFMGDGLGRHLAANPFGAAVIFANCPFDPATGRLICAPVQRGPLTVERSAAFLNSEGQPQSAFDTVTTNSVNARVNVGGTIERLGRTTTVAHASDRTVAGLAQGSTQRTVNGTSEGRETTTGAREGVEFTFHRVVGDTIQGVVIPIGDSTTRPYPRAGTIVRSMRLTLMEAGTTLRETYRREKITYNGSDTAVLEITIDGNTRTCTLPLPFGRPNCGS